jgi:hypothetical protein
MANETLQSVEVFVWATQERTFAASVGPGQIVHIQPSGDKWVCSGVTCDAGGTGAQAPAGAPRPGESEGALVVYDNLTPLQSFNRSNEFRELEGPLALQLGHNDTHTPHNADAIRVEVSIRNK